MERVKIKKQKIQNLDMIFEYRSTKKENINLFRFFGELVDRSQAKELIAEIDALIIKGENKILLNFEDLRYINSSGLNVLINILTKARKASGDVAICCVNKKIDELLVITKLDDIFNVDADEEQAIEKLNK